MSPLGFMAKTSMNPPVPLRNAPSSHPRRPPAHRSVSLLHSVRPRTSPNQDRSDSSSDSQQPLRQQSSDGKSNGSPSSLLPLGRGSSGESSNADRWFEKSNNDVRDNSASFADNDPPFFMRNSSSSDTPPDRTRPLRPLNLPHDGSSSLPLRTGLLHLGGTDGSSTEDFRSVIDDLTIENKKLKRRLKKYEKLQDSHLRDEKLFEVRIHGLPAEKKRELEETLRKFTASLGTNGFHPNGYEGLLPTLNSSHTKAGSSQTSLQNDSAYASMSASGQGSSAQSGNDTLHRPRFSTTAQRHQNIHSYLHHIPETLLLHPNPATMSERQKKRLVVRRLEQIFAGTRAAAGPHQHPMQQQEISQMAARESRVAGEALGHRARQEGSREAHIMRNDVEDTYDPTAKPDGNTPSPELELPDPHAASTTTQQSFGQQDGSFEQRPTRPLDLDPHRAQIPSENMRYIRHLGFSPPDIHTDVSAEEGRGWIYLNLLINMAQLHTIHVTADFVRKALIEYQSPLELSHDGRKVRWKGGQTMTATTGSSGGASSHGYVGMYTPDGQSPRKKPRLSRDVSRRTNSGLPAGNASSKGPDNSNKLLYTPLFFHKSSTESDDSSSEDDEDDSMTSPYPLPLAGDSSGMTSSGIRTISTKKNKRRDDGPIIFYNNARFCTDLSGDRKPMGNLNPPPYTSISSQPIGRPSKPSHRSNVVVETRGPLAEASDLPEPMDLGDNPIPESMELSFPPRSLPNSSRSSPLRPSEMEVSGLGGVWPSDHFTIDVESRSALVAHDSRAAAQSHKPSLLPDRIRQIISSRKGRKSEARMNFHAREIVSAKKRDLPPSDLPPALELQDSDADNDSDDDDDDMSMSPGSPVAFPPSAAPQPVELHYVSSEEEDDDGDDESSGSLDLLATAREVDPEAIRQKEREYDANMADRLAEEIPAGSSAATAGGGSGYASPADGMTREDYQRALRETRERQETLSRARTSDSMVVQGPQESSDEEDDEELSDIAS